MGEELNINIRQFNTPKELLTNINRMETVELKPTLIARKLEIQYILEEQKPLRTTSPFQIDMKNNAIQHAATIVNNLDSILATGIIPSDSKYDDLYTKIAKKTLNIIAANRNIIEFAEISAKFPNNTREDRDNSIKNLRAIAKKPTIVTIYAATKRTIIQYVYEALEDLNITITYSRKRLLARIIIKTSLEASPKEVELMNLMKKLVVKGKNTIT